MRSQNTFSTLFLVENGKAVKNHAILYVRVTVNGKRTNISLKKKIPLQLWDSKKKKAKGTTSQARQINLYLTQVESQLFQCYQDLKFKGDIVTAKTIKANFNGEGESIKTLQNILAYHTCKTENTFAKGTIRNFAVTEGYLNKFLKKHLKVNDVYLNKLDYKFICDFENFLRSYWGKGHPKAMGQNTVMKHIQRLRKMVTMAYHLEWIEKDPFLRWKPTFEKTEREFLSENELANLQSYDFKIERLDRVRDLFVFSCYTGIAYVDLMKLNSNNVSIGIDGSDWIFTNRQKTKSPVKVPLLKPALDLIIKYDNHALTTITNTLFPMISNEKVNFYLKEIADACGIRKNLTFHMARHTFATTVTLSNGVPIETVSKLLGHTKIASTQIYARVIEKKVSEDMQLLKDKIETPKAILNIVK